MDTYKKIGLVGAVLALVCTGVFAIWQSRHLSEEANEVEVLSPLEATYTVDHQSVTLKKGMATIAVASSTASTVTTRVFGTPVYGDIGGDMDVAALYLTQDMGGSGMFFYVAAAYETGEGWSGTNAVLLGDRIAPQNVRIENGTIVVNYADRKPNEPFSVPPSQGVSRYFVINKGVLEEKK